METSFNKLEWVQQTGVANLKVVRGRTLILIGTG